MKKVVVLSTLAAVGLASAAHGQAAFTLQLFLAARAVSGPAGTETVADVQEGGVVNAVAGTRYRVDVRYRINDNVADTIGSRGLSAAALSIARSGSGTGTSSRAFLTFDQQGDSAITDPDNSGITTAADGPTTGLIGQFRGGLTADDAAPNGQANGLSGPNGILPLALSNPGHRSWGASGNPTVANTNASTTKWAIYTFEFLYQGGVTNFTVSALPDATTGNRFGYFTQTGGSVSPVPVTSNSAVDGTITFGIPAPGAAALLGLGGLVATRRRRA